MRRLDGLDPDDLPPHIRVKLHSLHAQALLGVGLLTRANEAIRRALRLERTLTDRIGRQPLYRLQEEITAALAARAAAKQQAARERDQAAIPLDTLLTQEDSHGGRALVMVARSEALARAEQVPEALALAQRALEEAQRADCDQAVKARVFAHLALARTQPATKREHLETAWSIADQADSPGLITAVAHAARDSGVEIGLWIL